YWQLHIQVDFINGPNHRHRPDNPVAPTKNGGRCTRGSGTEDLGNMRPSVVFNLSQALFKICTSQLLRNHPRVLIGPDQVLVLNIRWRKRQHHLPGAVDNTGNRPANEDTSVSS